jgi:hypothetical protein
MTDRIELHVNRADIATSRLVTTPTEPLADGDVRLSVESYSLTANTATYAQFGDMLDYWGFYPVDAEWGRVPAIGWARVVESNVDGIEVGQRVSGWFPMATTVDVTAQAVSAGIRDVGAHRVNHAQVYRTFNRTDVDGMYTGVDDEDRLSLLRGLYITGFLIDQFFAGRGYDGAAQAIVLSASSKTALGYAACAHGQRDLSIVGVTSESNRAFVESTGLYDQIITYDQIDDIAPVSSVVIDMAGSGTTTSAIHARLGDLIGYSMIVGKSHLDAPPGMVTSGPTPELFFAPTSMDSCLTEWGPDEYARRTRAGLEAFIASSRTWLAVEHHSGPDAAQAAWSRLVSGSVGPAVGLIASLQ